MKKIFLSAIVAAAAALPTFAAVDTLNYSAVVRNAQGEPIANQEVSLMFQFIENDNVIFDETVQVTTSAAGVVNYAIGSSKSLDGIDWTANNIKLAVSMDVNGGSNFAPVSNSEVASVPTALYALKSADTENLYNDIDELNGKFMRNEAVQNDIFAKISAAEEDIDALYGKAERTESQISQIAADFANLGENLDNSFAQVTAIDEKVEGLIENLDNSFKRVEVMEEQVEANTTAIAEVKQDAYDAFEDIYKQLGDLEQIAEAVETLNAWHLENDESILSLPATLNAMNELLEENTADIEELQGKLDRNETVQNDIFAKISAAEEDIAAINGNLIRNYAVQNPIFDKIIANEEAIATIQKDAYDAFEDIYQQLGAIEDLTSAVEELTAWHRDNDETLLGLPATLNSMNETIEENTNKLDEIEKSNAELVATLQTLDNLGNENAEAIEKLQSDLKDVVDNMKEVVDEFFERFDTIETNMDDLSGNFQRYDTQYATLLDTVNTNHDEYQEDFQKMSETFDGLSTAFNELKAEYEENFQKMADVSSEMSTELDTTKNTVLSLIDVVDELKGQIAVLEGKVNASHPTED
ncbi:MAG: hypothetical protein K2K26_10390 [Muribaculaceae bacterium]|nr:hypothetical protein [Muribaculaceae bacterium]